MRSARVAVVGLLAGALVFSGASLAIAEDTSDAPAAATEGRASSHPSSSGTGEQATIEAPALNDPPSSPPAPALPSAPEQATSEVPQAAVETPPAPDEPAPEAPATDAPAAQDEQQTQDAASQPEQLTTNSASISEAPALRWRTIDEDGVAVVGATVTLQGPRSTDVVEGSTEDEQWADAAATTVVDNVGAADYTGLDLDPTPGGFRIEQFADEEALKADPAIEPAAVVPGSDYRVRVVEAEGYLAGDDAEWSILAVLTDASAAAQDVALTSLEPAARTRDDQDDTQMVTPMLVGPDTASGAAVAPYVYWSAVDANGAPVPGATFQIQGPRTSSSFIGEYNVSWNTTTSVPDCTSAPCTGPDLDADAGEFLVKQIGAHSIASSNRYRVRQETAPTGYTFVTANNPWVEIPGTRNTPSGWSTSGTYDFGDFAVRKIPPMGPRCEAGWVYGISSSGQIRQVQPNGTVTNLGAVPRGSLSTMNGLGIGSGGETVYALRRSSSSGISQNGTVYKYDTVTGTWQNTGHSSSALGGNTGTNLVGGAVNLKNDLYYFGGFTSNGNFKVYQYNPAASQPISLKGTVVTGASSSANGDIAFNSSGDLFIVRGSGTNTTVFSVTAANFDAASGGDIPAATSANFATMSDVNGVAFDSSGRAFLGSAEDLRSYATPDWSDRKNIVTSGLNSTDLATCSSPATITVEKYVEGARAKTGDQFALTLRQGSTQLGAATTSGNAPGLQSERIGPQPTVRGVTLNFGESAAGTTNLSDYASSWRCLVDGEPLVSGAGPSGSVVIPASGDVISCVIYNSPLTAGVTISKTVLDAQGENPEPGQGWTMGMDAAATTGTVTSTAVAPGPRTDADGNAAWRLRFGTASARATLQVSETQQDGYEFVSGVCAITPLDGTVRIVELASEAAVSLTDVAPGDSVACEYVNKQVPSSISWQKVTDDRPAANIGGSSWSVKGPGANGPTVAVADCVGAAAEDCAAAPDKDQRAGFLKLTGLAWGTYTITETVAPQGFELDTTPRTVTINAANAANGATIDPVVNVRKLGSVSWTKTDGTDRLEGSEWELTGPGGSTVAITDCVGANVAACAGMADQDPAPGAFLVKNLKWGEYTLVETSAPLGYVLDSTPHPFTVDAATAGSVIALGAIVNTLGVAPALPMTGGLSADFYSFFGLGVLLLALVLLGIRRLWMRRQVAVSVNHNS